MSSQSVTSGTGRRTNRRTSSNGQNLENSDSIFPESTTDTPESAQDRKKMSKTTAKAKVQTKFFFLLIVETFSSDFEKWKMLIFGRSSFITITN
jgi:hypothetical protein